MYRKQLIYSLIGIGACASIVLTPYFSRTTETHVAGAAERQPSSLPTRSLKINSEVSRIPVDDHTEVYEFDRRLKATLNQKEVLVDVHYSGFFFLEKISHEKYRTSFVVNDSSIPLVFAEVKISPRFELNELKIPLLQNEEQESSMLFLKDLLAIYAFRTFEDTTGKYKASLTSKNQTWFKKKTKYLESALAEVQFNRSIHEIQWNEQGIQSLTGVEETQAMANQLKTSNIYELKRVNSSKITSMGVKKPFFDSKIELIASELKTTGTLSVAHVDWNELKTKLPLANTLMGKERITLFHEIVKGLKSNPEKLSEFVQWIKAKDSNSARFSMGVSALATWGTPEAQNSLIALYDSQKGADAHLILNAMATSEAKLSEKTREFLRAVMNNQKENPELAINAAYVLGKGGDVSDLKRLGELSLQTQNSNERMIYLDALGNSGSPQVIPYVLEGLQSNNAMIREKSVFALRFVNDPRVKLIFEQYIQDSSASVRDAVVRAIAFQPNPQEYESMLKAL